MAHIISSENGISATDYTEVIVVRHGETAWNLEGRVQGHLDVELNDVGRQQAFAVADRLGRESEISAVYSSDLKRARETAQIIASRCNVPEVIEDPDLRERHLGELQGLVYREAAELKPDAFKASLSSTSRTDKEIPGGGESLDQLQNRCTSSLQKIGRKHKGQCAVVVTHGGVVRAFHKYVAPTEELPGKIKNTSINILHVAGEDKWSIITWGDISHLSNTGFLETAFGAAATVTRLSTCYYHSRSTLFKLSRHIRIITCSISRKRQQQQHHKKYKTMASSTKLLESASEQDNNIAPYGSWKSPITADIVSGASKRLGGTAIDGLGRLFWLESRPTEAGRSVLVKEADKAGEEPTDITPKDYSVRSTAQEYGGGAFTISGDTVIFANYKDQRLYKQSINSKDSSPVPLTPDYGSPSVSFADGVFDSRFNRFVTVMEDRCVSSINAVTTIVAIGLNDENIQEPKVLLSGNDFYAFPRIDPKGERIAWIEWGHPNMPWDKAELWVGYISENGDVYKRTCIAGGDTAIVESPTEPKWSSSGELFFITDRGSGFWNLYKWIESANEVQALCSLAAEFSRPLWVFGTYSYELIQNNGGKYLIACNYRQKGRSYLCILDYAESSLSRLDIPFTDIDNITSGNNCLYVEGASAVHPTSVAKVHLDDQGSKVADFQIVWSSSPDSLKYKSYFSLPEFIEFPTEVPGKNAYAFFYPPSNPIYQASPEEKPPLLLKSHGGPTSETRGSLNLSIQYWTSRGWAFVDVNYGGSTGYGREYRERLIKNWGIVDVNDCCSCAKFLVDTARADKERLCITGGSAGGYTTLAALAFKETFKAGASLYGVADLKMLRAETHKFESHYLDNLIGDEKEYFERSPINFVDRFSCPIILFQGLEDKVVPPDQARTIYRALKEKGLPVALVEYEGEQHGFRKAENIKFTLEQQMVFFARLIGHFNVADEITPIKVDNFDD